MIPIMEYTGSAYSSLNAHQQNFALPPPFLQYILDNCPPSLWKKLIETCKYFYAQNSAYPVKNLRASREEWFYSEGDQEYSLNGRKYLWCYGSLTMKLSHPQGISTTTLMPRAKRFTLTSLELCYQHISYEDYMKLTGSRTIEILKLLRIVVRYSDRTPVPIDAILREVPKLKELIILFSPNDHGITEKSVQNLLKLPSFQNLQNSQLFQIPGAFGPQSMAAFIQKHPLSSYKLISAHEMSELKKHSFQATLQDMLDFWKDPVGKPTIICNNRLL